MESVDLREELLVSWANHAFSEGERLQTLELKPLCLLIDSIIYENIYKDYNFLVEHGNFIKESEKFIFSSIKTPAIYFPYFTNTLKPIERLLFKEGIDLQIDQIYDNGGANLLKIASTFTSNQAKEAEEVLKYLSGDHAQALR